MLIVDGNRYLLEKELSAKHGLSVHWFRRARYEEKSPKYHKLYGKVYYREDEVDEWLKENMVEHG